MHEDGESRERGRQVGCGTWSLMFAGLIIGSVVVTIILVSASFQTRIDANLARVREAGEPVTAEELHAFYEAPAPEDDTTQLWLDATAPFETPAFESAAEEMLILGRDGDVPLPGDPWPDLDATKQFLKDYQASLDLLHEAAERGGAAHFFLEFELGFEIDLEEIGRLRTAARLLALEANVRAHEGDAHASAKSIHAMLMAGRSLETIPEVVSQLIRFALGGMAEDELHRLLPVLEFSEEDLRRLQDDLRAEDFGDGLRRALIGERVKILQTFETMNGEAYGVWGLTRGPDRRLTLDFFEQAVAAAEQPWPEALKAAEAAAQEVDNASSGSAWRDILYLTTSLFAPTTKPLFVAAARATAQRDATDAVIGIELFRRRNGSIPETLDELVPEFLPQVPIDPFDGQPLRYVVKPDRYVIYSVSFDGVDDGGVEEENFSEPDLVFEVRLGEGE